MKCVVLCAGSGGRLGGALPKALIPIKGKPILWYIIKDWVSIVDEFVFVIGYRKDEVLRYVETLPLSYSWWEQKEQIGTAHALLQVSPLNEKFLVVLGDCLIKGTFQLTFSERQLGIGVWAPPKREVNKILSNYSVRVNSDGYITEVEEKPKSILDGDLCGMGYYFFDDRVFDYIKKGKPPEGKPWELTYIIKDMVNSGETIAPIYFKGKYINVNTPKDLEEAEQVFK